MDGRRGLGGLGAGPSPGWDRPGAGLPVAPIPCMFCPDCPTARTARGLVLGDTFWLNALVLVLPFVIALVAGVLILRRLDRVRKRFE